ncbi:response regulator [Methylobacterium sp. J-070]|uniref:response regulator n=1 Tax=Methylobacterium sp. J-070 TaxID=2836650 RepID=UPI001FBA76E7|nr:response regulator [Methylobacterium sp. J-070]MCJ2051016.1 response regulator [Methylobacterium sp. J-070]
MMADTALSQRVPSASHRLGVLIVDDDAVQLMDMAQTLADAGMAVFEASSAGEALGVLKVRTDVRVMISDVDMRRGDLNGYELAKAVSVRWPEIGLLIVSGQSRPKALDLPEGARFMNKPCAPSALIGNVFAFASQQNGGI